MQVVKMLRTRRLYQRVYCRTTDGVQVRKCTVQVVSFYFATGRAEWDESIIENWSNSSASILQWFQKTFLYGCQLRTVNFFPENYNYITKIEASLSLKTCPKVGMWPWAERDGVECMAAWSYKSRRKFWDWGYRDKRLTLANWCSPSVGHRQKGDCARTPKPLRVVIKLYWIGIVIEAAVGSSVLILERMVFGAPMVSWFCIGSLTMKLFLKWIGELDYFEACCETFRQNASRTNPAYELLLETSNVCLGWMLLYCW